MLSLVIECYNYTIIKQIFLWFIKHNFVFHLYQLFVYILNLSYLVALKLMIYVSLNKYNSLWQIEKKNISSVQVDIIIIAFNLNYKNRKFHWIFISNKKKKKEEKNTK